MGRVYQRLALAARALRYGEQKSQLITSQAEITEEEIREMKQFFPMDKFFIFGHARSGTTLLARLIRVHPDIHCNWQAHFFTRPPFLSALVTDPEVGEWLSRRSNRWNRGQDISLLVMRAASDFILEREAVKVGKSVVGDKSPNNLVNGEAVKRLAEVYPDAKLIFIVRDGRDAVLSHQIQKFIDLTDHLNVEETAVRRAIIDNPQEFINKKRSIFSRPGLAKAAQDWVNNVSETNQLGAKTYMENYLSLRFEDLVENPNLSLDQIWSFLGVDVNLPVIELGLEQELAKNPDADWQREKQHQVADLIRKGLPGSWRDIYTQQDIQTFKDIAGETLIELGYEDDLDW
jgi:hypothetical protein